MKNRVSCGTGKSFLGILTAVVGSLMICASVPADAQPDLGTWSTPVQISSQPLFRGDLWGSNVYEYGWDSLAVSDDGGVTWNGEVPFDGKLCTDGLALYRVNGSDVPVLGSLVFSKSLDNGVTWSEPVFIMAPAGSDAAYRIAIYDSTLIVYGFVDAGTSYGYIKASRSIDYGATWSPEVIVDDPVHCEDPLSSAIVYLGGKVYMTYYDYGDVPAPYSHIVVTESSDLGASWGDRRVVGSGYSPMIAADASAIYVTYWDEGGTGLYFTKSTDGDSWSTPVKVGDIIQVTDAQVLHSVTAYGGTVFAGYITYYNPGSSPEYHVHVNYSGDGGSTWEDMGDVTDDVGNTYYPNVMFDGMWLHLTWYGSPGVTYYRSLTLHEPIPEFGNLVVPMVGIGLIVMVVWTLRGKRSSGGGRQ